MATFLRSASVLLLSALLVWGCSSPTSSLKSPASLTVTYNPNGATSGSVPVDGNTYQSGSTFTVLGNTGSLAISGAPTFFEAFGGWTGAGGNGLYLPGETASIGSSLTLYASWGGVVATMTGTASVFTGPCGIVTDGPNLYVADFASNVIRKIVISSSTTSTLAGSGTASSVDGTGLAASFDQPYGLAIDGSATNLYVTDQGSGDIRKIVISSGVVTTLAGTGTNGFTDNVSGTLAQFNLPNGIATDGTNLYVADLGNGRIRKLVIATLAVTTLAGNGTAAYTDNATGTLASFYGPSGLAYDSGNLYVSGFDDNTIRQISLSGTNPVTTLAGSGSSGMTNGSGTGASFNNPSGLASDGAGNLYLADTGNHMVRKIVIATGTVTTIAGSGTLGLADGNGISASFHRPFGVAVDGTSLYVADFDNHMIRLVN